MIRNYMVLTIRNFLRNKLTALINIIGVSIALAFGTLALLFAHNEWTYDQFHDNVDRIYRICLKSGSHINANTLEPLGPAFANEFSGIKVTRAYFSRGTLIKEGSTFFSTLRYVDPEFLDIFSFPLVSGNTALHDLRSVVITQEIAQKLFPNTNPVGQAITLKTQEEKDYIISGVLKNIPKNSSLQFDVLLPFEATGGYFGIALKDGIIDPWKFRIAASTFFSLPKSMTLQQVQDRLPDIGKTLADKAGYPKAFQFFLQPLKEIHFDQSIRGPEPVSNPIYSYVLAGIALIIILVAGTNFSALTIGISSTRGKEVGIRKLFGAHRQQLIGQYLGESIILSFLALILGISLVEMILPMFNTLMGKELALKYVDPTTLLYVLILTLSIGAISGFYPAIVLSRFQTVEILTTRLANLKPTIVLRILLIFQFALSTILLIGALTMTWQIEFIKNKNLGFYTENVLLIRIHDLKKISPNAINIYTNQIASYPQILNVTRSEHGFSNKTQMRGIVKFEGQIFANIEMIHVGYDLLKTLNFKLLEGRDFSREIDAGNAVIVNEAFVKYLGWENGAGQMITSWQDKEPATIIGVVEDFHFQSLHHTVLPAVLILKPEYYNYLLVRISPEDTLETLAILKKEWLRIAPATNFQFSFFRNDLDRQYRKDQRWLSTIRFSAICTLFLASLGAFGLTTLSMTQRNREIGIRKVLGASVNQLIVLLSKDFIKWVILANVIAWPIAYYALSTWLQVFAYRIDLMLPMVLGSVIALLVVAVTVSIQTYRAATDHPANVLRHE